jgi:hypothetical protein
MRIQHLLESKVTSLMGKDPDGLILAKYMHQHLDVLDSDTPNIITDMKMKDKIMKVTHFEDIMLSVFVIKGKNGWAILTQNDNNHTAMELTRVKDGKIHTTLFDGSQIDSVVDKLSPSQIFIINTIGNHLNKHYHKSIRDFPSGKRDNISLKLGRRNPSQKLPNERSFSNKLWTISPKVFLQVKRDLVKQLKNKKIKIGVFSSEDEVFNVLDSLIDCNGNLQKISQSEAESWLYSHKRIHVENIWNAFVTHSVMEMGYPSVLASQKYQKFKHAKIAMNDIIPRLTSQALEWFIESFFSRVSL